MKQRIPHPTEPKVRLAKPQDIPAIRRFGQLVLRCASTESDLDEQRQRYLDQVLARMWNADYLRKVVTDPRTSFLVADAAGEIIGIALAIQKADEPRTVALSRLNVLRRYHRGSLPQRLLWGCEQFSPGEADRLETCVPQADAAQRRFYESQCFCQEKEILLGQGQLANVFHVFAKPMDRQRIAPRLADHRLN